MPAAALALVLTAAVFHSCWNALAKRAQDQFAFLCSALAVGAVLFLPVTLSSLPPGGVPAGAWPFVVATVLLHALYFVALGRSYRSGEFSLVYPMARGLGVALVPILAVIFLDERPSALGAFGIAFVALGIVALQWVGRSPVADGARWRPGPGTGWALLTGVTIGGYALVDKAGVSRLHPVPYIGLMFVGSLLLLLPVAVLRRQSVRREWAANWRAILITSALTLTAYLLVLFAFRLSKVGYVVAAREVSIVISVVIGRLWFGERRLPARLAGATLVLTGVICLAFAR
ncbi:MAG: EamA family transporter [Candidatus Rokuibacteriota bacterium]|nr:MAG: EamA family transporter [Candidatus Rokubacteria bacterium]